MKPNPRILLSLGIALLGVLVFSGCGKSPDAAPPEEKAKSNLPVKEIEVTGDDQMKFNITKIEAQPRQRVTLIFKNVGTMPKESMGHNFVLLKPGTDVAAFIEAGFASASTDYVAEEVKNQVIAKTKILGPGESVTLNFTAPSEPGTYTYVCTFPGHQAAGMQGILVVQ
jgi:azurin